jgi:DNA-binding response OmpR family regulator
VLLDLKLPKVWTYGVLRAVRASHRVSTVPVVMLVPASEPRELAQCYQLGANSCVCKPVEYAAYYATVQTVGRYWLTVNQPPPAARGAVGAEPAPRSG